MRNPQFWRVCIKNIQQLYKERMNCHLIENVETRIFPQQLESHYCRQKPIMNKVVTWIGLDLDARFEEIENLMV